MLSHDIGRAATTTTKYIANGIRGLIKGAFVFGAYAALGCALYIGGPIVWGAVASGGFAALSSGVWAAGSAIGTAFNGGAALGITTWAAGIGSVLTGITSMIPGRDEGHDWFRKMSPSRVAQRLEPRRGIGNLHEIEGERDYGNHISDVSHVTRLKQQPHGTSLGK